MDGRLTSVQEFLQRAWRGFLWGFLGLCVIQFLSYWTVVESDSLRLRWIHEDFQLSRFLGVAISFAGFMAGAAIACFGLMRCGCWIAAISLATILNLNGLVTSGSVIFLEDQVRCFAGPLVLISGMLFVVAARFSADASSGLRGGLTEAAALLLAAVCSSSVVAHSRDDLAILAAVGLAINWLYGATTSRQDGALRRLRCEMDELRASHVVWSVITAGLMFHSIGQGPDYKSYAVWAETFVSGNLGDLDSPVISPTGVPMSQWSAGPGLVFGGLSIASAGGISPRNSMSWTGWCAALIAVGAFFRAAMLLARRHCQDDRQANAFAMAALTLFWLATPGGYYLTAMSSEELTLACGGLLSWMMLAEQRDRWSHVVLVSLATGVLLAVRAYLIVLALPVVAVVCWDIVGARGTSRTLKLVKLVILGSAPLLAALQIAIVNHWMTGSHFTSPYTFGDEGFRSFDWRRSEWFGVTLHSFHGLLAYHPLYAVGACSLMALTIRSWRSGERVVWGSLAGGCSVILAFHAAWYVWWLASTVTFGMRGMTLAAMPVVLAVIRWALGNGDQLQDRPMARVLGWSGVATALWSWLLLIQGPTDFPTWGALLASQLQAVASCVVGRPGWVILVIALAWGWVLNPRGSRAEFVLGIGDPWRLLACAGLPLIWVTLGLKVDTLADQNVRRFLPWVVGGILASIAWRGASDVVKGMILERALPRTLAAGGVALVGVSVLAFARLASSVHPLSEAEIARLPIRVLFVAPYFVPEALSSLEDYNKIPGYESEKRELEQFLDRQGFLSMSTDRESAER